MGNNTLLEKAICFAVERHSSVIRKATTTLYILHPLEVMQILGSVNADIFLLIAGVLHNTIEDTDTTIEEIEELFGDDVADLVSACSEDKSKSWDERKTLTIESLKDAPLRVKMLIVADKIADLRSIAADYKELGEDLWQYFDVPKEKQAWYYCSIRKAVSDLQYQMKTQQLYLEITNLCNDLKLNF